ncbi:MAG: hypothetical protein WKF29_02790 [Thermoleophilaceae bacterium]
MASAIPIYAREPGPKPLATPGVERLDPGDPAQQVRAKVRNAAAVLSRWAGPDGPTAGAPALRVALRTARFRLDVRRR